MKVEIKRPGNTDSTRLKEAFTRLFARTQSLGFDAVIYHYTPVPRSPEGELITPSLLEMRNAPDDMHQLWCERGYYQADPVQHYALQSCAPFVWSYQHPASSVLRHMLDNNAREVSRYMCENNMSSGATVPLHLPNGGFVTLTGILTSQHPPPGINDTLARMMFLAHHFQETAFPLFDASMRTCHHIRLRNRERECLAWSAEGLTAKQIARKLHRSVATITLHLNTAAKKLGATNRVQAVVRAMHYRLLDS
ncbi:AhyR/AsaR family transcriptional regulator [Trabulsiella guamensis ATCC 49490]|uniref:AhyR/AsaR family transcriptional regulator n=1 Tax=Trabulsiella guamensis ATCC 49490 TaxID=1005994 RepID=A0A084ZKT2_9ENTR|nr:LuxR family transcriptional regulator [Trabulsiella guamensis]KFB98076.1 AhyR/AsaR family transcriptional regulator [Trabulsiella guamensis ATCC 49490]